MKTGGRCVTSDGVGGDECKEMPSYCRGAGSSSHGMLSMIQQQRYPASPMLHWI